MRLLQHLDSATRGDVVDEDVTGEGVLSSGGVASRLMKAALAVQGGVLPPTLHVATPNPALEKAPSLYLNTETRPWVGAAGGVRRAGVSAFGFGGTNYHLVLESPAAEAAAEDLSPRAVEPFVWRRTTRAALRADLTTLRDGVRATPTVRLDELARAVLEEEARGEDRAVRLAIVASSVDDLVTKLGTAIDALDRDGTHDDPRGVYLHDDAPLALSQVAFLFPGQGAQRVGMLRDLVHFGPFGSAWLADADALLDEYLDGRLSDVVYPRPSFTRDEERRRRDALEDTRMAQPAVGALDVFASDVLERFGIRPAMAAGHSYGEYVALWRAGVYTREGLLRLSALRGKAVAECARHGAAAWWPSPRTRRRPAPRSTISAST